MKKKVLIAAGIVSIILVMAGVSVYRQVFAKGPAVSVINASKEVIADHLMIPGTLDLKEEQKIYSSPEKGELKDILVKEGDEVKKGTVLAKFDDQALSLELEKVKLQVESGYLRINQLEKSIENLKDKEKELRKQVGKKKAKEQVEPEKDQLAMEKRMANLDLHQVLLQQKDIEKRINELEVKSSVDGTILQINKEMTSDPLAASKPTLYIGKLDAMAATGLLSEFDTLKVKEGQKVKLKSDAIPEKEWDGEVSKIGNIPEENQTAAPAENRAAQYSVLVEIKVDISNLKPGFQLIMEIETDSKEALTIPAESILTENDEAYVYVLKGQKSVKQEVKTGISSGSTIEIISGLTTKDKVISNPPDSLQDGMEVNEK